MDKSTPSFSHYSNRVSQILSFIDPLQVNRLLESIRNTVIRKGTVYVLGNGGSASTASHFVNDLSIIAKRRGVNVKAISLVDSFATITAIGNDNTFDDVFKIQLMNRLQTEDLVFCVSASGNSRNLINAVEFANALNVDTSSLLGFTGGILKSISRNTCLVPTNIGEYGPVEDVHLSVCHYLSLYV